jgi:exonuclease III
MQIHYPGKNNLTDIWRENNPSVKKYTFRSGNSKSRIDLILISEELSCHIINIKIIHCPFSDHYPLMSLIYFLEPLSCRQ